MNKTESQGLMVFSPKLPEGKAILEEQKLTLEQLHKAIENFAVIEDVRVATLIGVNHLGFFYSRELGWHPENPDAFKKPLGCIPWVQIHELLGKTPSGATEDFLNNQGQPQ